MNLSIFKGFLTHHVSDLKAVASAVGSLLDAVPINAQDRSRIEKTLGKLATSASNIGHGLDDLGSGFTDHIRSHDGETAPEGPTHDDVRRMVEDAALALVPGLVADALAKLHKDAPAPAPVIAPGTPGPNAKDAGDAATGTPGKVKGSGAQTAKGDGTGDTAAA